MRVTWLMNNESLGRPTQSSRSRLAASPKRQAFFTHPLGGVNGSFCGVRCGLNALPTRVMIGQEDGPHR